MTLRTVTPRLLLGCLTALLLQWWPSKAQSAHLTVAAAADLKFALDEIVADFRRSHPQDTIEVSYGSSGKFHTQIQQGAPYDMFFSADIAYPRALQRAGWAGSPVVPYAIGRLVLWSPQREGAALSLNTLVDPSIQRIAIANPRHAPYGLRAEEALRSAGLWEKVESKLVYGENIAQAAQFVQTGNAQVGLIALSLALSPELSRQGRYTLVAESLHTPLEQGYIITKGAEGKALARQFAQHMDGPRARAVLTRFGFERPASAPSP